LELPGKVGEADEVTLIVIDADAKLVHQLGSFLGWISKMLEHGAQ